MRYTTAMISLAALTSASQSALRRQAGALPAAAAPVFAATTFDDFSISEGPAGNCLQKAQEKLAGLPADLATVNEDDVQFLDDANQLCNQAERGGFDVAIETLGTPGAELLAMDAGKTCNKILKLQATLLRLEIQKAQADDQFDAVRLANETVKMANNVQTDALNGAAGIVAVSVPFNATTANLEATENETNKTRELAVENLALQSRQALGLADPPGSKTTRDNAAAKVEEEKAAGASTAPAA